MFKQRLLSLPAEKWRESIIMKNAFILSCHSCFSPPPFQKKERKKKRCCVQRVLGPSWCVSYPKKQRYIFLRKVHQIKKKKKKAELELIPNPRRESNCAHQAKRLMMIDAHWLNPPPTRDYGIFSSPPEALSPSAPFGLSEEACRRSRKMLMWFPPSRPAPTLLLFSALEIFPLIKLINSQETEGVRGANFHYGTSKVLLAHSCTGRGGRNIRKEEKKFE